MGAIEGEPTLLEACKDYIRKKYAKPGNVFLGVVSRLDAFVTGVIVFARTSKAASRLTKQFQQRTVEKKYLAIVEGNVGRAGKLENWIVKNDAQRRMVECEEKVKGAKLAQLRYRRLSTAENRQNSDELSLVEVELLTGRKHQIRVQFSLGGHTIVGDRKYGSELGFQKGIALHAQSLSFEHPTLKSRITVRCEPPKYWNLSRFAV